jgi:dipeptidyl aminopeptidase/acylaminoacyl peptidase
MKTPFFLMTFLVSVLLMNSTIQAQETPILDRELFFGNPQISSGQLSPDGKLISFMKAHNGIMNVWVKDFNEPFENARLLTDSERPLYGYAWTEDGKYILFVKDKDGDENINVFAVDPYAPPAERRDVPESRNLTPLDDVTAQMFHVSQKNPDLLWVGLNDRDKAWHDLYQLKISTGELTLLYENNDRITGYEFDWDDNLRLLSRTDEKGNTTLLRINTDGLTPIYETLVTEGAGVLGWNKDNKDFYLETNKGDLDLSTVYLMNPDTLEMKLLESDPEGRVDFGSLRLDRNTREIISTSYTDDRDRHYWKNKSWEENYKFLEQKFPGREIGFASSTNDYSKFLISVSGDRYASEAWFFNAETKELIHQYTPRPELKAVEQHLAPMEPVRYASSDGLEIPGYLTVPVGKEPKNLPLVVLVHGGPKGPRDNWGYDPEAQFLANRGYAVLQPNFRASGGYGKAFLNAGDLQWGKLMQDDITWGVKHLIEKGIADPNRVGIMGGSYGGYATLAGLAFTPDVYACGVDIVGPSNLFTLLESIPPYWEAGRAFLYGMTGDPKTEEGSQRIREASPLFSADKINKPLLIIQGANDPRVKKAEADQIVIALRDRGHYVSYLLAEDEGHGFAKPVNRMAMYAEVEQFLANQLGGRYQSDMPSEVSDRLEELRVDIKTVVYVPADQVKIATDLPELALKISAGTQNWSGTLEIQNQELPLEIVREIVKKDGTWMISDTMKLPFGEMRDAGTYSAQLLPISRDLDQAGTKMAVIYGDGKISYVIGENNEEVEFSGAMICDGPARDFLVASLPLDSGYEIVVQMPDLAKTSIATFRIKVEGNEREDGQEYVKVNITNIENEAQKTTLWINPESREVDRVVQILPALANAKLDYRRKK